MAVTILHTNDLHGQLTRANWAPLSVARNRCDLYFDTGDCIKTGNLGVPLTQEPVWELLAELRCDASVIGNRETHVMERAFKAKLAGASHPVLCANLVDKTGGRPLPSSITLERAGIKIGVLGVSVAMVTPRMVTQAASAYLWEPPIERAGDLAQELRPQVDLLIALTHIGNRADLALAEQCPEIDVILGGHSHTVLQSPVQVGSTWVAQGGSHARFFGEYSWDGQALTGGLVSWVG